MNQIEMSVTMKKHYDAKWVSQKNCFRFSKHGRCFEFNVVYGSAQTSGSIWIDRMYLVERIIPDDENGKIKTKILASLDERPRDIIEVRRWINRQLIGAFLDEHCEIPQPTTSNATS